VESLKERNEGNELRERWLGELQTQLRDKTRKRAQQAIDAIKEALLSGWREVVDADLSGYFDTIPHAELTRLVKGRVSDGSILRLIKGWLRAPDEGEMRTRSGSGRKPSLSPYSIKPLAGF